MTVAAGIERLGLTLGGSLDDRRTTGDGLGTFPIARLAPRVDTVPMLKQVTDRRAAPRPVSANDVHS
jgi:hypothetical protein